MKTTAIAPWFGCARMIAHEVGSLLRRCRWVGIPFGGGMPEVVHITAPTIVVADVHRHIINLANCLRDPVLGPKLYRRLRRVAFHDHSLAESQEWCKTADHRPADNSLDADAAYHYFVAVWMGRSGKSGTADEFNGRIPVRWNCNGGDSATRFRSAVSSIVAWRRTLQRCNVLTMDCFEFLDKAQDASGHGIYCDPPFPDAGDVYRHKFSLADHLSLAKKLSTFRKATVVCRFYDHPLIRDLYQPGEWIWREFTGRKQSNAVAQEVLLTLVTKPEAFRLF